MYDVSCQHWSPTKLDFRSQNDPSNAVISIYHILRFNINVIVQNEISAIT